MALQKQYWDMTFGQAGRVKRVDEKVLESPNLSELINGEIVQPGKIQKRNGYVTVEDDQTDDYGLSVGTRAAKGSALVSVGDYNVTEYNETTEWSNDATSLLVNSSVRTLISNAKYTYSNVDIAYYNGYYYITATRTVGSNNAAHLFVFDSNYSLVARRVIVVNDIPAKLAVFNSLVAVVYRTTNTLYMAFVDQTDFTLDTPYTISSSCHATVEYYDVTAWPSSTNVYIAFSNNTPGVSVARAGSGGLIATTTYNAYGAGDGAIAVQVSELSLNSLMLSFCNTTNGTRYVIYNNTLNLQYSGWLYYGSITDTIKIVIGTWLDSTEYYVATQRPGSTSIQSYIEIYHIDGDIASQSGRIFQSAIAHKSALYALDSDDVGPLFGLCRQQLRGTQRYNYNTYYTVQIKSDYDALHTPERVEPIAKYLYRMNSGIGGGTSPRGAISSCVVGSDSETYHYVATDIYDNIILCTFSYSHVGDRFQKRFHSVRLGNDLVLSGSIPLVWDGQSARELGFSHPPEIVGDTVGSSGSIADGTYSYVVIYKITDNSGRMYKSLVSTPYTVTVSGGSGTASVEIAFTTAIYRPDWDVNEDKDKLPTAELYRTENGPGDIYYKVGEIEDQNDHAWFSEDYPAGSGAAITDIYNDSDITGFEYIYTTGGVLEQCAPPPLDYIAHYNNRLWGIDSETGNIPYSAEIVEGEGPWFNAAFVVLNPVNTDKPVALVDTQAFLMVFYKDQIGAIYGQGYNDLGTDGNLTSVIIIVNNLGCSEQKSIIKTPMGVIFKAQSGFHIIGYDGSPPRYIGGGVSDYDSSVVVSASLIQNKKQVRFVLSGTTKPILVYNYEFNQWYIWGYSIGSNWCTKTGGCVVDNAHYIVNGDTGNTLVQDSGYLDGVVSGTYSEAHYIFSITTPWIKLAGLQGFKRVLKAWILGTFESNHDMSVEIDYDYDDSNTDTVDITDLSTEIGENLYQVRIGIPNQRCQAIRFKITIDTSSYSEGAGATLTGLRLEYMAKRGGMRAPNYG